MDPKTIEIDYTNWRGERSIKKVIPDGTLFFGSNEWHSTPQWLFGALDVEKGQYRIYALCGVHGCAALAPSAPERLDGKKETT